MIIKRVYKRNNEYKEFDEKEFHSFNEVVDYCEEKLHSHHPCKDFILFGFEILDSGEVFTIRGKADGEDSYVVRQIDW